MNDDFDTPGTGDDDESTGAGGAVGPGRQEAVAASTPAAVAAAVDDGEEQVGDTELARRLKQGRDEILAQLRKTIIGQDEVLEQVLMTLFVGGNSIITGVPGLAKTLIVQTMARILRLDFSRIQFTPDLMPADITGTEIIQEDHETGRRSMVFMPGPIFSQIVLADEINRTPPKTQAALLEAMQEHRVTVQGKTYELDQPFFVFATQNPIELEGTYPLPEAQLDRFMFNIIIEHLDEEREMEVVTSTTSARKVELGSAVSGEELRAFHGLVRRVPVSESVLRYAVRLVRRTRPNTEESPDFVDQYVEYGGSVRAAQYLILGGKARALMDGRFSVGFDDIKALARPVLRHRLLTNFQADSERITSDDLIERLVQSVPVESSGM
ncbi:MAG: AAA family ATPase [Acidobacteria bacterium]|nr:MAG: AAA family ATPase [Acidobacteriota bacterium]REK00177.1 MAG: AAA family ATPase [Acidobacteriota bacterium]